MIKPCVFNWTVTGAATAWANVQCHEAYLQLAKRVKYKSAAECTAFAVGLKKSIHHFLSYRDTSWPSDSNVCLPLPLKKVYTRKQQIQEMPTPLSKNKCNQKSLCEGACQRHWALQCPELTHRLAEAWCTQRQRKYELNTCCMSLFRWQKSIFARRSHLCFSKRRRGRRTATGECTWRLREMPLTGTTWLTATGMNNTPCRAKQKLGSRNTTRENGTTGPESPGTEPGQCIFVSISSLLRFPVKRSGGHTFTASCAPVSA